MSQLSDIIARLSAPDRSDDELAVIDYVLSGLEYGAKLYGPLDLDADKRNWRRERAQECRDQVIYDACENIARYRRERLPEPVASFTCTDGVVTRG